MASKEAEIHEIINDYSEVASIHGAPIICGGKKGKLQRLLWLIILVGMVGMFVFTFAHYLKQYFEYGSTVSVSIGEMDQLSYPAITICNMNMMKRSKVVEKYPDLKHVLELQHIDYFNKDITTFLGNSTMANVSMPEILDNTKHDVTEMFPLCYYGFQNEINCSDYFQEVRLDRGICFTFNQGSANQSILNTQQPGIIRGISIFMDMQPEEYIYPMFQTTGMLVSVHDQSEFPRMQKNVFVIGVGDSVHLMVEKRITKVLSRPYSRVDCVPEGQMDDYGYPYSEERCMVNCLHDTYRNFNGGCSIWDHSDNECSFREVFQTFVEPVKQYGTGQILCKCNPQCRQVNFKYQVSIASFGNIATQTFAREKRLKNSSLEEMRKRYSELSIYYSTMKVKETVQQEALVLVQMLSSVGGMMGLFMGASLITLVELVDFVLSMCASWVKKFKSNNIVVKP